MNEHELRAEYGIKDNEDIEFLKLYSKYKSTLDCIGLDNQCKASVTKWSDGTTE